MLVCLQKMNFEFLFKGVYTQEPNSKKEGNAFKLFAKYVVSILVRS